MFAPDHSEFDMQTAAEGNNTWLNPNPTSPRLRLGLAAFRARLSLFQL